MLRVVHHAGLCQRCIMPGLCQELVLYTTVGVQPALAVSGLACPEVLPTHRGPGSGARQGYLRQGGAAPCRPHRRGHAKELRGRTCVQCQGPTCVQCQGPTWCPHYSPHSSGSHLVPSGVTKCTLLPSCSCAVLWPVRGGSKLTPSMAPGSAPRSWARILYWCLASAPPLSTTSPTLQCAALPALRQLVTPLPFHSPHRCWGLCRAAAPS